MHLSLGDFENAVLIKLAQFVVYGCSTMLLCHLIYYIVAARDCCN